MSNSILTPEQYADLHKAVTAQHGELSSHVESLLVNLYCVFVEDVTVEDKVNAADDLRDDATRISNYFEDEYRGFAA